MTAVPSSKFWWIIPLATVIVMVVVAMFVGQSPDRKLVQHTTYDAGPEGFRAAYLTLDTLDYPVSRSRRPPTGSGRGVRFVLYPFDYTASDTLKKPDSGMPHSDQEKRIRELVEWTEAGGLLVLGDPRATMSGPLDLLLKRHDEPDATVQPVELQNNDQPHVAWKLLPGPVRIDCPRAHAEVWATLNDEPLVSFHARGRGLVCVLHRPACFSNRVLIDAEGRADNAVVLCRLTEELLRRTAQLAPGRGPDQQRQRVAFDETVHGLLDRPGVLELLLQPPTLWVTVQGLLFLAIVLWHFIPRFGQVEPNVIVRRRSKEEFLDALAELLDRKADYADAFRTGRDALRRDLEVELGLSPAAPIEHVGRETGRRPAVDQALLQQCLDAAGPASRGRRAFLDALHHLDTVRAQLFHGRPHR